MSAIRDAREAALVTGKRERELDDERGRGRKDERKGADERRGGKPRGIARKVHGG